MVIEVGEAFRYRVITRKVQTMVAMDPAWLIINRVADETTLERMIAGERVYSIHTKASYLSCWFKPGCITKY